MATAARRLRDTGIELVLEAFEGYWRKMPQVKTINLSDRYVVILPDLVFDTLNYLSFPLQRTAVRDMQLYSTDAYNHNVIVLRRSSQ